jgi:adenosylhomocysteine nucleosidase
MSKLAIIAADAVEVGSLVRGWKHSQTIAQRHTVEIFEQGDVVIGFAGMGPIPARIAADAVYKQSGGKVAAFLSVGYAGALSPKLKVADLFEPKKIICAADETEIINSSGQGTLISAGAVAGIDSKAMMARQFGGDAIDMEAYSVADVARIYGVPFRTIKVISDEIDFPMPPMGRFIDECGRFNKASFAIYAVMRPWIWSNVWQLARNSSRATGVLYDCLQQEIETFAGKNEVAPTHATEVSR